METMASKVGLESARALAGNDECFLDALRMEDNFSGMLTSKIHHLLK